MAKKYGDRDILRFLERIDVGIAFSEEEKKVLSEWSSMNLSGTRITALPESIGQLANLQTLDLSYTRITALPESLGQLANLQTLDLHGTRITALPESLGQLANLQKLYLDNTRIIDLPTSLGQLAKLQRLDLERTRITALPDWLGSLPALRHLDLKGLTLPSIPEALALRGLPFVEEEYFAYDKPGVNLWGVRLTEQKKSVFLETPGLIPELYRKEELVPVRACKVIFLGDGGVGKSYTIRRFRAGGKKESKQNPYQTEETHGVEIGDYPAEYGGTGFDIHFWDFGGQEILHSMHRCFLTEESCYVVMVRTRETESTPRARYWLRAVQTAAPNSPVLLFVNCWGNARGDRAIDATRLEREFPQIRKIVYCSAQQAEEGEFRREFMDPLLEMAAASDMCGKTINRRWDRLIRSIQDLQRNAIEKREQNYLDRETYLRLCGEAEIGEDKTGDLLTLLNNLGVCFSYHRDPESSRELPDYKLLNPVWLTNALYAIVEEGAAPAQAGIITVDAIRAMLHNAAQAWFPKKSYRRTAPELVYADEECQYILDVAQAHRLCYRVDAEQVFFPALCGTDSPQEALTGVEGSRQVSYLLRYSYLPDSVLHQLMIRCMQSGMVVEPRWLKGMVLSVWKLHTAHVRIAEESLRIDVYSKGEQRAYELFWTLRREIEEINRRLRLSAKEFILDEGKPEAAKEFPLGAVLGAARENTPLFDENGNKHDARALLGQFYEESFVQTMRVENGAIVIPIAARSFHPCAKGNPALRKALYEAYNEICPYCSKPIANLREMEVDHILPAKYPFPAALKSYGDYLNGCGFDLEKPDYIENYFPTHGYCNRDKSNRVNEFTLPYWHDIAAQHGPRVLRLMEELQRKEHLADD